MLNLKSEKKIESKFPWKIIKIYNQKFTKNFRQLNSISKLYSNSIELNQIKFNCKILLFIYDVNQMKWESNWLKWQ